MNFHSFRAAAILLVLALLPAASSAQEAAAAGDDAAGETGDAVAGTGGAGAAFGSEAVPAEPGAASTGIQVPDIVKKIKALQDKIKQSQERMDEVVNMVLNAGAGSGAKAVIALDNTMSESFVLVQAVISLDGAPIYKKADDEGLTQEAGEIGIFDGAILPGEHTLSVLLVYRGAGYGLFSYLKGYKFKVRSSHKFKVKEGKGVKVTIVGYEKGDQDTKMEDRPAIKYTETKTGTE